MPGVNGFARAMGVALGMLALCAAPSHAAGLETILQDDAQLLHRPDDQLRRSLEELKVLGVDRIRVTAGWSVLTRDADSEVKPGFDATDPRAYEHERWRNLDRLLVLAREKGLSTMVDVAFWAPRWASADPPGERGRTSIDAQEYAKFAVAVARRYSGDFKLSATVGAGGRGPFPGSRDQEFLARNFGSSNPAGGISLHSAFGLALPAGGLTGPDPDQEAVDAALGTAGSAPTAPLPKVDVLTLWNEPNHSGFMRPQWVKRRGRWMPRSPQVYRDIVLAAYPALKAVRPELTVLVGATAAYGSYSGRGVGNVPPLRFIRELACVDRRLRPIRRRSGCGRFRSVPGDGWSHHPYTMETEPDAPPHPGHDDDVPLSRLPRMAELIDRLVARGRLAPGNRNLWITEYGYETNPPVPDHKFTPGDQARFLPWAEYIAQSVPTVRSFAQFLLRDLPPGAFRVGRSQKRAFGQWQSGLLFEDGTPKLGAYSFRTGLFVRQRRDRRITLFGRLRLGEGPRTVRIERRPPGTHAWRTVRTKGPGGRRTVPTFTVGGRDAFLRFGRGTRGRGWRYRVLYLDGTTWRGQAVPSVAPVLR